jgi:UDP-glucuronate decarboxylase
MIAGKRALVAGGAGFVGSHLCDALLRQGWQVVCLDSLLTGSEANLAGFRHDPNFRFVKSDITEPLPPAMAEASFDEIYNLACAASPPAYQIDPEHTMLTSVLGTRHLLQLAERHGARLLQASTSEIYGDPLQHPQSESYCGNVNPTGPRACYDEGKRAAETLCFDYDRQGRATVRVARIFNTYGPRLCPEDGRVVSNLVKQALEEGDLTIYGDGRQTRSFCYIDDLVRGLIALMRFEGRQPGPVNLGNPHEVTMLELASTVLALTESGSTLRHLPLPIDDPRRRRPDIAKAKRLLGWAPEISLERGLAATIDWFRQTPLQPRRPLQAVPSERPRPGAVASPPLALAQ